LTNVNERGSVRRGINEMEKADGRVSEGQRENACARSGRETEHERWGGWKSLTYP
jgi:hypothetical protein